MSPHQTHPEHSGEALTIMKVEPIRHTGIVVTRRWATNRNMSVHHTAVAGPCHASAVEII